MLHPACLSGDTAAATSACSRSTRGFGVTSRYRWARKPRAFNYLNLQHGPRLQVTCNLLDPQVCSNTYSNLLGRHPTSEQANSYSNSHDTPAPPMFPNRHSTIQGPGANNIQGYRCPLARRFLITNIISIAQGRATGFCFVPRVGTSWEHSKPPVGRDPETL